MSQFRWVGVLVCLAMLTGCGGSEDLPPSDVQSGQRQASQQGIPMLANPSGSLTRNFSIHHGPYTVVAGTQFKVVMTVTGNPDLYVRFGAAPTTTEYDCRSDRVYTETCDLTVPTGITTAYVMVRDNTGIAPATYSMTINYIAPAYPDPASGTPMSETREGSVAKFANANYGPISAMAGTQFKVTMAGTGDPDLYVRFGAAPTTTQYDCRPYAGNAAETCNLTVPVGAPAAYIMVNGYSAATFSLTLDYTKP